MKKEATYISLTDVRVGDWVLKDGEPHQITISDLEELEDCRILGKDSSFTPMPLTLEIMEESCTGSSTGDSYIKQFYFGDIDSPESSLEVSMSQLSSICWLTGLEELTFEYVHELQALLFAFSINATIKINNK